MRFNSSKSLFIKILIPVVFLILAFAFMNLFIQTDLSLISAIFVFIIILITTILLAWMYFKTFYEIRNDLIYYRCGPFHGKLDIKIIREIEVNKTMYVGFKPALDINGLIVKYNKWEDIYFSPEKADEFIAELIKINPSIVKNTIKTY